MQRNCFLALMLMSCGGETEEEPKTTTLEWTGGIVEVAVNSSEGQVSLSGVGGLATKARITPSTEGDGYQESITLGRLTLGSTCGDGSLGCGTNFEVEMPVGVEFEVTTQAGNVSIADLTKSGVITTQIGDVTGSGLGDPIQESMRVEVTTLTSDVQLQFDYPPTSLSITSGTGNVRVELPAGEYDLAIDAGGEDTRTGDLTESSSGPLIEIETGGDVEVVGS